MELLSRGAVVFPSLKENRPYRPGRSGLYTVDELLEGFDPSDPSSSFDDAVDSAIYRHSHAYRESREPLPILESLAQRLHDHAIDDALDELLHDPDHPRKVVAVMGGHALKRDEPIYAEVTRLGRGLVRAGYFLATGGGPGAMEASQLGAWLAGDDDAALETAVATLAQEPDYRTSRYVQLGLEVRDRHPNGPESLAIPTWFYGHEPTNTFATHVAKYFSNSLREDGLLAIAHHGIVFTPGSAGTVQEVFQDAAQNHYRTCVYESPMVFLGREFWTERLPAWQLVQALSNGRSYSEQLAIVDDVDEAVDFIVSHPPR
ncbi:MAG: hypothetical protein AAF533_07220 [Acidobacteriota bacterium]